MHTNTVGPGPLKKRRGGHKHAQEESSGREDNHCQRGVSESNALDF